MQYKAEWLQAGRLSGLSSFGNGSNFLAVGRNVVDGIRSLRGIALQLLRFMLMEIFDRWQELCSYENLKLAFSKARKRKTLKPYVIEFEKNLKQNLLDLQADLLLHSYSPKKLETFVIRDPKTRKISKSDFRDRVVHHALCNIIEPIFEKTFIHDSFANQTGKGSLKALERFDYFKRKVSKNNTRNYHILKADIKHYFDEVNHNILLDIIKRKVKDKKVIWLIKKILDNYTSQSGGGVQKKGMPLGNLTSQFFANIYLNELDQFVKHELKAKYYIRYVDDFVILSENKGQLQKYKEKIDYFLKEKLDLQLHPNKSKIIEHKRGVNFLGFRVFYHHRLLRKTNVKKMRRKLDNYQILYDSKQANYDLIYEFLQGWTAYAKNADTYNLRSKLGLKIENYFPREISTIEINRALKECNTDKYLYM